MGELLEKYMEMSEGKQESVSAQTTAVKPVHESLGAQKPIVVPEDAEQSAAPKLRGTKRNR